MCTSESGLPAYGISPIKTQIWGFLGLLGASYLSQDVLVHIGENLPHFLEFQKF
jgi:hypothetical protein